MTNTVHLGVYDTLADWEAGHAIAAINKPDYQREPGRFRVRTVGATTDPITTVGGVRILRTCRSTSSTRPTARC
jgi:hypothetical protein